MSTSLQIESHWSKNLEPEMTLDKLQVIANSNTSSQYKVRWLKWWNASKHFRAAKKFPSRPFNINALNAFLHRAVWWSEVNVTFLFKCMLLI